MSKGKQYPDNSEIFARKAQGRRDRARQANFAEKLDAVDALRARVAPIIRARESRKRDRRDGKANQS
jgi:hypothetical protein